MIAAAVAILLALAAAAVFAGLWCRVGRIADLRLAQLNHAKGQAAVYRREAIRLSAECGQLRERVAELLDERTALVTGEPSLTESVLADLAALPTTHEREYPL